MVQRVYLDYDQKALDDAYDQAVYAPNRDQVLARRERNSELARQHLYAVPSSLCARNPEVPVAVEQVVFSGLSKDPARRFVDMLSFALAFEEAS